MAEYRLTAEEKAAAIARAEALRERLTAATPPPPRDGEVDGHWIRDEMRRTPESLPSWARPVVTRPAAPSEPPAADSPTPGTETREHRGPCAYFGCAGPAAPSPVGTTEPQVELSDWERERRDSVPFLPPAEAQQDDERRWRQVLQLRIREAFWAAGLAALDSDVAHVAEGVEQYVTERLAARPSDDTETLREQVETWIDEAPEHTAGLDLLRQIIGRPR